MALGTPSHRAYHRVTRHQPRMSRPKGISLTPCRSQAGGAVATMLSRTDAPAAPFQGGRLERTPSLGAALDAFLEDKALSSRARHGGTVKNLRSQLRPLAGDTRPVAHFDARFCRALMASRAPPLQTSR